MKLFLILTVLLANVGATVSAVETPPPGPLAAVDPALRTRAARESAVPVRPGVPGAQPFWNERAVQFLYAPAFDFKEVPGAQKYRFVITPEQGKQLAFEAEKPFASLAPVWLKLNAGEAKLDLSGAGDTTGLDGTANAGSLSISLPSVPGTLAGSLHVNAGTIRVCVPATAGLRIRVDGETLASDNFAQRGMTRSNDVWTLPSWNTSSSRIDLTVTANLGTIMLNPEEGCG